MSHNKYCFSETFRCGSRKLLKNSILGEVVIVKKFNIKKFNIKHYEVKVSLILFAFEYFDENLELHLRIFMKPLLWVDGEDGDEDGEGDDGDGDNVDEDGDGGVVIIDEDVNDGDEYVVSSPTI